MSAARRFSLFYFDLPAITTTNGGFSMLRFYLCSTDNT